MPTETTSYHFQSPATGAACVLRLNGDVPTVVLVYDEDHDDEVSGMAAAAAKCSDVHEAAAMLTRDFGAFLL